MVPGTVKTTRCCLQKQEYATQICKSLHGHPNGPQLLVCLPHEQQMRRCGTHTLYNNAHAIKCYKKMCPLL